MKKLLLLVVFMLFVVSCGNNDTEKNNPEEANKKVTLGVTSFENTVDGITDVDMDQYSNTEVIDFRDANELFEEAVELDGNNLDARLGAAVTQILALWKDSDFKKIRDAVYSSQGDFTNALMNKDMLDILSFINNKFEPAVDKALAHLAVIESHSEYVYTISSKMQGGDDNSDSYDYENPKKVDVNDIKLFIAVLKVSKGFVSLLNSVELTLNDYSLDTIVVALSPNGSLFKLKDANKMKAMLSFAKEAVDKAINGLNAMKSQTGAAYYSYLIERDQYEITDALTTLNKIKSALESRYVFDLSEEETLTIDIPVFINNFPQDIKTLLPSYKLSKDGENSIKSEMLENFWILSDVTFAGLLPYLTQDKLNEAWDNLICEEGDGLRCEYYCDWDYNVICTGSDTCSCGDEELEDNEYCSCYGEGEYKECYVESEDCYEHTNNYCITEDDVNANQYCSSRF